MQMYLGWSNSLLCEQGVLIDGLHQLRDGSIFCHLIELLTGTQLLPTDQVCAKPCLVPLETLGLLRSYPQMAAPCAV